MLVECILGKELIRLDLRGGICLVQEMIVNHGAQRQIEDVFGQT